MPPSGPRRPTACPTGRYQECPHGRHKCRCRRRRRPVYPAFDLRHISVKSYAFTSRLPPKKHPGDACIGRSRGGLTASCICASSATAFPVQSIFARPDERPADGLVALASVLTRCIGGVRRCLDFSAHATSPTNLGGYDKTYGSSRTPRPTPQSLRHQARRPRCR